MTPLKILRKIVKFVRGSAGPLHIFLACLLGTLLGFVPGFNLTLVLGIALLVVLNVNLGMSLTALALGKVLSVLLAPVTYEVGFRLIHGTAVGPAIAAAGDTPVLALLNLHYYCLLGGLLLALPLGAAMGLVMGRGIQKLRRAVLAASDRHAFIGRLNQNRFYRIALRVLFGKGSVADALAAQRRPLLRTGGLVVAGVLVIVLVGGPILLVDSLLAGRLAAAMGRANGAEVDIERVDLSVFAGRIVLTGLQVTDPAHPERNLLQADRLAGDVSILDLLARRVVIDLLEVDHMRTDVPRGRPGEVYPRAPRQPRDGTILTDYFEKAREYEKYLDYLERLRRYLEERPDEQPSPQDAYARARERAAGYFALSAADILPRHPALTIRRLTVNQVPIGGIACRIDGENVSSNPMLNREAMALRIADLAGPDPGAAGQRRRIGVAIGGQARAATLDLLLTDLPVPRFSAVSPVDAQGGRASLQASGSFLDGRLHLPVQVSVTGLAGQLREGQTVLGLSPATSAALLEKAQRLSLVGTLDGPLDAPRWQTDQRGTLAAIRETLAGAATAELAAQLGSQIERLGAPAGVDTGSLLRALPIRPGGDASEPGRDGTPRIPGAGLLRRLRP